MVLGEPGPHFMDESPAWQMEGSTEQHQGPHPFSQVLLDSPPSILPLLPPLQVRGMQGCWSCPSEKTVHGSWDDKTGQSGLV